MDAIRTEKLTKFYGATRGIMDVDLTVAEGDFFGFVGPNGAGKSTLIRTLLGLIAPTSGGATVLGQDIRKNKVQLLSEVGYLPSEAIFYNDMRIKDLLAFSAKLRGKDCTAVARGLCERLELDPSQKIGDLSLGNRKKVGIVCTLQHEPRLYILDEPTSGLDPLMQREFFTILQERNAAGATIFLSSHILSEVSRYCKHVGIIRDGQLLVCDSVDRFGHTGSKQVVLRGLTTPLNITNAYNVQTDAATDTVRFFFAGDAAQLIQALSALTFADVNITDPDFEDTFIHYYDKEATESGTVLSGSQTQ